MVRKNGADAQTRTADLRIHTNYNFRCHPIWDVCGLDFPFIVPTEVGLDAHRQVSTPFPFGIWLGIAILQVSPTLMSFHS